MSVNFVYTFRTYNTYIQRNDTFICQEKQPNIFNENYIQLLENNETFSEFRQNN